MAALEVLKFDRLHLRRWEGRWRSFRGDRAGIFPVVAEDIIGGVCLTKARSVMNDYRHRVITIKSCAHLEPLNVLTGDNIT